MVVKWVNNYNQHLVIHCLSLFGNYSNDTCKLYWNESYGKVYDKDKQSSVLMHIEQDGLE